MKGTNNIFRAFGITMALAIVIASCSILGGKKQKEEEQTLYGIYTKFGVMKVELYDETPLHKANFEKLVADGTYDSLLFHRVIKDFMIQGGDPDSKNAPAGAQLGTGGPGYTVPAEIQDSLLHFKGSLAAARQGDQVNPERASSGSQFYIVDGRSITDQMLDQLEVGVNNQRKQKFGQEVFNDSANINLKNKLLYFRQVQNRDSFNVYLEKVNALVDEQYNGKEFVYSDSARAKYKAVGGTPSLDGSYTVFGRVVEGLDIIDSIANVQTGRADRPANDIIFTIKKL